MNFTGFASAALQLGAQAIVIKPLRGIFNPKLADGSLLQDIQAQAVVEEIHHDELEITEHPVERGAAIADHAFKRPEELVLKMAWSNSPSASSSIINAAIGFVAAESPALRSAANAVGTAEAAISLINGAAPDQINAIYQQLLNLQSKRALFFVATGKRVYSNMVCKSLAVETDFKKEHSLFVTMTCRQVILVNTDTFVLPKGSQANPSATASPASKGSLSLKPSGAKK